MVSSPLTPEQARRDPSVYADGEALRTRRAEKMDAPGELSGEEGKGNRRGKVRELYVSSRPRRTHCAIGREAPGLDPPLFSVGSPGLELPA
jgi:hypothetical protein